MNFGDLRVHHIGCLVTNIEQAIKLYGNLGYKKKSFYYDSIRKIKYAFLSGEIVLELVCPDENSAYKKLYEKYSTGPYHICYATSTFDQTCNKMRKLHFLKIGNIEVAKEGCNNRMCFFYNTQLGLIEIYEI